MNKYIRKYTPGGVAENLSKKLSFEECRAAIGGYIEVHTVAGLHVLCDEEGYIKQLPRTINFNGIVFCGVILVGDFSDKGLQPVSEDRLEEFERCLLPNI